MEMGFMPNAIVEVTQNNIFGICCKIGDSSYAISQEMASFITVELLDFVS
jgi:Fe2+ transport system protein FeoA